MVNTNTIHCYKVFNKESVVRYFYATENESWHKFIHKRAGTEEENIQDTLNSISESSEMFVVTVKEDMAAFFVKYKDESGLAVEGFHVHINYRTPDFLNEFWKIVKDEFAGSFYIGIFDKNKPAIKHLVKQGATLINEVVDNDKKYFIFNFKY